MEQYNDVSEDFVEIASNLNQTSWNQTDLTESTKYKYRVRARNEIGFGNYSSEISISTLMGDIGQFESALEDL